jgi:hypothetical protein
VWATRRPAGPQAGNHPHASCSLRSRSPLDPPPNFRKVQKKPLTLI